MAVVILIVGVTDESCPYVSNYYFSYSYDIDQHSRYSASHSFYSYDIINECKPKSEKLFHNNTRYNSTKIICINDQIYKNFYTEETCEGKEAFQIKVREIPGSTNTTKLKPTLQYQCQDTGCTNYFIWEMSNSSFKAYNHSSQQETCVDPGLDDYMLWAKTLTDICFDNTDGYSYNIQQSKMYTCNHTGAYYWKYSNTRTCDNAPNLVAFLPAFGCPSFNGTTYGVYGRMRYCNGIALNDAGSVSGSTAKPTSSPVADDTGSEDATTQKPIGSSTTGNDYLTSMDRSAGIATKAVNGANSVWLISTMALINVYFQAVIQ